MFILFVTKCSTENLILTPIPTQCPDLSTKERLTEICKFKRGKPKKNKNEKWSQTHQFCNKSNLLFVEFFRKKLV